MTIYLLLGFFDRNYVILRTNRAKCALKHFFFNLLNEESVSGVHKCRASRINSTRSLLQVFGSRSLKCHSNFFGGHIHICIHIYIHMNGH